MRDNISKVLLYKSERLYAREPGSGSGSGSPGGGQLSITPYKISLPSSDSNKITIQQSLALDDNWFITFDSSLIDSANKPAFTQDPNGGTYYYVVNKLILTIYEVPSSYTTFDKTSASSVALNNSNIFTNIVIIENDFEYFTNIQEGIKTHTITKYLGKYPTNKLVLDLKASYNSLQDYYDENIKSGINTLQNYYDTDPNNTTVNWIGKGLYVSETFDVTKSNTDFQVDYTDSNGKLLNDVFFKGDTFKPATNYLIVIDTEGEYISTIDGWKYSTSTDTINSTATYQFFKTPGTTIAKIDPTITNSGFKNVTLTVGVQNSSSLTIYGNFEYKFSTPPYTMPIGDDPIEWGFYFRKEDNNTPSINWLIGGTKYSYAPNNTINNSNIIYDTNSKIRSSEFFQNINGLSENSNYYSILFVKKSNGDLFYSQIKVQKTPPASITSYITPTNGVKWYQIYKNWELVNTNNNGNNTVFPFYRIVLSGTNPNKLYPIFDYVNSSFYKETNYQFKVITENFNTGCSFSMKTPWGENFEFKDLYNSSQNNKINLYLYTNINSTDGTKSIDKLISSNNSPKNPITFIANDKFGRTNEGLIHVSVNENSWTIQGFALFNFFNNTTIDGNIAPNGPYNSNTTSLSDTNLKFDGSDEIVNEYCGKGWHFIEKAGTYIWLDKWNNQNLSENSKNLPIGGDSNSHFSDKTSDDKWRKNNFIAKKILNQTFNISFDYEIDRNDIGIKVYLSGTLPVISNGDVNYTDSIKICELKGTGKKESFEMVGLQGNQYIVFVGDPIDLNGTPSSSTYSICRISNLKTAGGYHSDNNLNYETSANFITKKNLEGVTYSTSLGQGDTYDKSGVIKTKSKAGNGRFNSGIWENGVWNSGWREDKKIYEFYKVNQFSSSNRDKKWKIEISGPESSVNNFSIGDKVSISNIVAIDINEERKLLTKYYTILSISTNSITVEFESDFPLRRIEKDSENHRILITKNIWLSGVFLNGYFKGIWNNGLFSGYPLISKMDQSHWINGIFNGGHFTSNKYKTIFQNTKMSTYENIKRVGLIFSSKHKLNIGDIISVSPNGLNPVTTVIISLVSETELITGITWNQTYSNKPGEVYTTIGTGLIQNFDFYSNNVSNITSLVSMDSKRVFSYNSWIDVNYSNQSAVNIGKPQSFTDEISGIKYSENNLYGYPTIDILSSNSTFRDSFSTNSRKYKLGTKYKIFDDYVGDASKFEDSFDSTDTQSGLESFNNLGWKISKNTDSNSSLTFSRTPEPLDETSITKGNELMAYAKGLGGNLNLSTSYGISNRSTDEIEKLRYSVVEFDLKFKSNSTNLNYEDSNLGNQPPLHFNNLNYVNRNVMVNGSTQSKNVISSYLPIYENINHLKTSETKKQEFFFNRRNLLMNFRGLETNGSSEIEYYLDNIKYYQVDMVPFFQYFTVDNINKSVQIPTQLLAPSIDWVDEKQETNIISNFVDNLVFENVDVPININWISDYVKTRSINPDNSITTTTTTTIYFNPPEWINPIPDGGGQIIDEGGFG
jgi:hypothetical protein